MKSDPMGFTIIEMITTLVIVSIMSIFTVGLFVSFVYVFVYTPKEIKVRSIAGDAAHAMTEGDGTRPGIRYTVQVYDASASQFTYLTGYPSNTDKFYIRLRWDSVSHKVFRSSSSSGVDVATPPSASFGAEETLPYYAGQDAFIYGTTSSPSGVFKYYKADGTIWSSSSDALTDLKRVDIEFLVRTGSGDFAEQHGSYQLITGIEIKQYN